MTENKFCDKLIQLRKEKGMSQEQLADYLNVSRQAVSKWEADQSMPSLDKLIQIADLFSIPVDHLVRDSISLNENETSKESNVTNSDVNQQLNELRQMIKKQNDGVYEFKSKTMVGGLPLVHIKLSRYGKPVLAKGIIAIGNIAIGLISVGAISLGLLTFGAIGIGLLLAMGAISIGGIAFGGMAAGIIAFGGLAAGVYAFGGVACASKIAAGGVACAPIAIGDVTKGTYHFAMETATKDMVKETIKEVYPSTPSLIRDFFTLLLSK